MDRKLWPREREVLALLAQGLSNEAIAERLCLHIQTVRNHTMRLYDKLGIPDDGQTNRRVLAANWWHQQ